MTTTKSTSWADQGDGTAWLYVAADPDQYGWAVALDRPCDTCKGKRDLPHGFVHPRLWGGKPAPCVTPCPDCINGRHTFTLDVAWQTEVDAYESERHRVSVVPGMILPIVDEAAVIHGRVGMPAKCITVRHDAAHIHDGATVPGRLHLFPPDAKPGGFAVLVNWRPA